MRTLPSKNFNTGLGDACNGWRTSKKTKLRFVSENDNPIVNALLLDRTNNFLLRKIGHVALAFTLHGIAMFALAAGNDKNIEYQTKANYLYKFCSYVEWPPQTFAQSNVPITIGVLGADELAQALSDVRDPRSASGRGVVVKLLQPDDALGESLRGVQILFIGRRESTKIKKLLEHSQAPSVLIVTESVGALDVGSMINFIAVDEHVRFEVSVLHAERSGLKISARLLAVAQKVETRRP